MKHNIDKHTLVKGAFPSLFQLSNSDFLSIQRFDPEWSEDVDIEVAEIQNGDKIKVKIIKKESRSSTGSVNCENASGSNCDKGVNQLISNLEKENHPLNYKLEVAVATLQSLKEIPRPRPAAGRNLHFTCSNCHLKGHRVNTCYQQTCNGFYECGQLALHKEHREELKQVYYQSQCSL